MGSIGYFSIGGFTIAETENSIEPEFLILFDESDKIIEYDPDVPDPIENRDEDEDDVSVEYAGYSAELSVVKDRLDLMGFTIERARRDFTKGIQYQIEYTQESVELWTTGKRRGRPIKFRDKDGIDRDHGDDRIRDNDVIRDIIATERWRLDGLLKLTFDSWVEAIAFIVRHNLENPSFRLPRNMNERDDFISNPAFPEHVRLVLAESWHGHVFGPFTDFRCLIRGAIKSLTSDIDLSYDISELVNDGYVGVHENLVLYARRNLADALVLNHKTIILTEGVSDQKAISGAIQLLVPHLAQQFSFLDFNAVNAEGGTGSLINVVKAFAAAGIVNRIVAVFDNDTAGQNAEQTLSKIRLPENIRVLRLPPIDLARRYPTEGPQGPLVMDVNGLAASIELYFGEDVLRRPDGCLPPIQWTGYDKKLKQYQGEIIDKLEVQKAFERKIEECRRHPDSIDSHDWSAMRAIVDHIRTAFHDGQSMDAEG